MFVDAWLPSGFTLPKGGVLRRALYGGRDWQIIEIEGGGRAAVVTEELATRWVSGGLVHEATLESFRFGDRLRRALRSGSSHVLAPVASGEGPRDREEALSFAIAFRETRAIDPEAPLQDALYVEKLSRLLPTYEISSCVEDDVVLGYWLTGGVSIPARSFRRLHQHLSYWPARDLKKVVEAAGFDVQVLVPGEGRMAGSDERKRPPGDESSEATREERMPATFELPGRPGLAAFFNEHIVDIVQNRERYQAVGIRFPSAVVLHGSPGTGKTFAVERLVEFLGWPSFSVDASSIASPYIHETSRKIAEVFETAVEHAPSVLIIDEMDAFLADRDASSGHHRVEEVAEFLRRIPGASEQDVLVIAMTNRIDLIDPAVLRRGRFDHVIEVGYASAEEVRALLENELARIPMEGDMDVEGLAAKLARRPLSDVSFVVREAARLAARSGKDALDEKSLQAALAATPVRGTDPETAPRIGFV